MAAKVEKKQASSKNQTRINEIIGIVLLAVTVLTFLCLVSYSPNDRSFNSTGLSPTAKTQNWIGPFGANFAELLVTVVGYTAYLLPAMLVLIAWRFFRSARLTISFGRLVGYVLFIVSLSSLITLFKLHGGIVGVFFERIFVGLLGPIGTGVLLFALLATAILLITNLSFAAFFGDFRLAWENFLVHFDEWRGKRRELREANDQEATARAEKRLGAAKGETVTGKKPTILVGDIATAAADEKKETVTKKVSEIFSGLKNLPEQETEDAPEIIEEIPFEEEIQEEPIPTISASDENDIAWDEIAQSGEEVVREEAKPIDLIAESEKIPITPIQETGDLDAEFLDEIKEPEAEKRAQSFEDYVLPTGEFLSAPAPRIEQKDEELLAIAQELTDKTKEFNVTGRVMHICQGPVVTTYEFKPDPGVKYSRVTGLSDDLCLALKAESIRIDRIPGKAFVGIEVPNRERETIHLREVIESKKFQGSESLLSIALGKSIDGLNYVADLAKMPHLLIAGATGAGKSVGVNTLVVSILYKAKPDEVKFIMVDPKRLELGLYADIPHLATPIITDPKRAAFSLKWAVSEMERRYKELAGWGVRNIDGYNAEVKRRNSNEQFDDNGEPHRILPYIVIIIDELADLMMTSGKEVEESITRLAQMARAVGIHLVLATQRPSVDVITGLIKANFPARISFRVSSKVDSRTIIDANGAEQLLGKGDMLFLPPATSQIIRVHGAFVDEKEISRIVEHIKKQGNPEYDTTITKSEEEMVDSDDLPGKKDALYLDALKTVVSYKRASTSLLQRQLRIGYGRAAAILDAMVHDGYIGDMDGSSRARPILQKAYDDLQEAEEGREI
ncbi:MAG TPA: DNA translocase FtsK [Pyrinomonadaceae bacterium]|jgi:S-DNA-T family DNA segregation ATPase FtsK/SpoIIIE